MAEMIQANAALLVAALFVLLLVMWFVIAANRKARIQRDGDAGEEQAKRNQALIDAPPAVVKETIPPPVPEAAPDAAVASAEDGAPVAASAAADDLTLIKGLGPKIAAQLNGMGVTTFAQIAAWDDAAIDRVDAQMGRFAGRIRRDQWVAQARLLAAGDSAGFAAQFGNR
ncbi:hypothetical protein [Alteraurantiacibacter palmitatis]|uniref:Uncharacterized protein n=1 Tax=Alteraurantiacibacter palmitatis TaxID=2054628 RepID=A0ABV7EAZ3_9SPHN